MPDRGHRQLQWHTSDRYQPTIEPQRRVIKTHALLGRLATANACKETINLGLLSELRHRQIGV